MRAVPFTVFVLLAFAIAVLAQAPTIKADGCEAGGGCLTMTRAQLVDAMTSAHDLGVENGRESGYQNGQKTCWRPA